MYDVKCIDLFIVRRRNVDFGGIMQSCCPNNRHGTFAPRRLIRMRPSHSTTDSGNQVELIIVRSKFTSDHGGRKLSKFCKKPSAKVVDHYMCSVPHQERRRRRGKGGGQERGGGEEKEEEWKIHR